MIDPSSILSRPRGRSRRLPVPVVAALVFVLSAAQPLRAQSDWAILDRPTTRDLNKLSFVDNLHGWVVGDSGTILMTTDGGSSWTTQTSPVPLDFVDIDMIDGQRGWALAQQLPAEPTWAYGTSVVRTTNGGAAWIVQSTFNDLFIHAIEFTDSVRGCMGGDQGRLWWTSNGGGSWNDAVVESPTFAHWPVRNLEFYSSTYGLATGGFYDVTGLVWRTTNGGEYWTHRRVAGEPFFGTYFHDSLNVVCVGGDLDYGAGMVQSVSAGEDWTYTYLGIWGQASAVSFRTPSEGWAPLGFAGTFMVSLDGGTTWTASFTPDSSAMADVVFTDSDTGYMVGAGGTILKYIGSLTSVGDARPARPSDAMLLQNAPNPFQSRTEFGFRVARLGRVSLRVYDLAGREVATLIDEEMPAGTYTTTLDGRALASGVYYYKLSVGKLSETRKMVLIR